MATEKKKALIVVRTYPTPAKKHIEVSCTAAIADQNEWLRLFLCRTASSITTSAFESTNRST